MGCPYLTNPMKNLITNESVPNIKPDVTEPLVNIKPDPSESLAGIKP